MDICRPFWKTTIADCGFLRRRGWGSQNARCTLPFGHPASSSASAPRPAQTPLNSQPPHSHAAKANGSPKPRLTENDFSWAKGSLTSLLGGGQPVGCIEAFESLAIPSSVCAWATLAKKGCIKRDCKRCAAPPTPGANTSAPKWAIDKVKGACSPDLLALLK